MILTREQLLEDLYVAYYDARRHKRHKPYQQHFEAHLEANLATLCNELYSRTYRPQPSTCFLIEDPKKREVFAADFRDRIVHHLYYNYTHELFERTFIADSYSCIKGRGTHYGIRRLEEHIRKESQHYTQPCYVMKMDICGYFMHINRSLLLEICLKTLEKMATHRVSRYRLKTWQEVVDFDFVRYLTAEIVLLNPIENCRIKGERSLWRDLPSNKSLFNSPENCGLPIGNLTSQLFSNIYLNELDQFVKRTLKCRHYGRYVDDFFIVSCNKMELFAHAEKIKLFLETRLHLKFHEGKHICASASMGVEFLGAYLKPFRKYVSRHTFGRICRKISQLSPEKYNAALCSYRGVLSHGKNFLLTKQLLETNTI